MKLTAKERKFGLESGDYEWLLRLGNGACWICGQTEAVPNRSLAVDHDHRTGAVRGLLCTRCNYGIGVLGDDLESLRRAERYLVRAGESWSDGCVTCMAAGSADCIVAPCDVLQSDGMTTLFAYQCAAGHEWRCTWRTLGVPFTWGL